MAFGLVKKIVPSWKNTLLAVLASALLIPAFPDFEIWFLAWFALVPLMLAVERETKLEKPALQKPARSKGVSHAIDSSITRSFVLGWIFGTIFFSGSCWWLTYAPINYAGFPPLLAYFLLFCVTAITGLFPGIFAAILSMLVRRFGSWTFLAAPFVWVFVEFLRYWLTGNNWNAIGYSQAFAVIPIYLNFAKIPVLVAGTGGVLFTSFVVVGYNSLLFLTVVTLQISETSILRRRFVRFLLMLVAVPVSLAILFFGSYFLLPTDPSFRGTYAARVLSLQPNVPMKGLTSSDLERLRDRQVEVSENKMPLLPPPNRQLPTVVIFPESPMNFMYSDDREFQHFVRDFTTKNNVSLLFNSAEPDIGTTKYFNSAVMVGPDGKQVDQYDKIYLLPFGEAVPSFLEGIVPGFVGNFAYGREYDLFPVGDAKAGVMICFESHFGALSREYVRNGADVIIEMTNDGYLGPTPVLRQHLANAVFRAVETNRPVLRVTNVGITAYINEKGNVLDATQPYQEDTRVWSVSKSDGSQTFYVKYGDWFAWLCSIVTFGLLVLSFRRTSPTATNNIA